MPQETDLGWVVELPEETALTTGFPLGSLAVLYAEPGSLRVEIPQPPSQELEMEARQTCENFEDAFEEMGGRVIEEARDNSNAKS